MFDIRPEVIATPALKLGFHVAPWDRPAFGADTAVLSQIEIIDPAAARRDFRRFRAWCRRRGIALVACRLDHARLDALAFLEGQGFRFIELNYRPYRTALADFAPDPAVSLQAAAPQDRAALAAIAGRIFAAGRLQVDPMIDSRIGDRRYAMWASNAFDNPDQSVVKCLLDGELVAFMVIEAPSPAERFWSLVGLVPAFAGRGIGRRIWQHVLACHHREGVDRVTTSISSHNTAVHNLYVALGFRFPAPLATLHWCPAGPVAHQPVAA